MADTSRASSLEDTDCVNALAVTLGGERAELASKELTLKVALGSERQLRALKGCGGQRTLETGLVASALN